jgi:predicted transcriptional regulator
VNYVKKSKERERKKMREIPNFQDKIRDLLNRTNNNKIKTKKEKCEVKRVESEQRMKKIILGVEKLRSKYRNIGIQ